jgi:SAM-dependent methyltransferase
VRPDRRALVRSTYDALAEQYAAHLADELSGKEIDRMLLDRFAERVRDVGPVCELGCGPAHVARYLHDRGVDVFGIDLSPAMVEQARGLHPGMSFREGDMLSLDVDARSLAGVVSFYAIVHLQPEALKAAFCELHRVLRPGGLVLLAFHVGDEAVRPRELWGIPVALDWVFFQTADVVRSLAEAGLTAGEVIEREPYEGVEHPSRRAYIFATREAQDRGL